MLVYICEINMPDCVMRNIGVAPISLHTMIQVQIFVNQSMVSSSQQGGSQPFSQARPWQRDAGRLRNTLQVFAVTTDGGVRLTVIPLDMSVSQISLT